MPWIYLYFKDVKVERGNKATDWSPAPQDVQSEIDGKNKTYYQDLAPAAPSGGHKPGDLWYKISLTDGCYESYRWNGSAWQRKGVYVSQAKQTITDSAITNLVEKTAINSLGTGETLWSKINQTADKITIEVNKIQIGGRNYVLNSEAERSSLISASGLGGYLKYETVLTPANLKTGDEYYLSFEAKGTVAGNLLTYGSNNNSYLETHEIAITNDWKRYAIKKTPVKIGTNNVNCEFWGRVLNMGIYIRNVQLEKGNKATDWSLAPEDTQAQTVQEVASSFTLDANKIILASKTIELKGNTIAKAIEAEDLKVGSRTGLAALEVLKNGTFYAKGSNGANSFLEIDSAKQSIIASTAGNKVMILPDSSGGKLLLQNAQGGTVGELSFRQVGTISFPVLFLYHNNMDIKMELKPEGMEFNRPNVKRGAHYGYDIMQMSDSINNTNAQISTGSSTLTVQLIGLPTSKPTQRGSVWRDGEYLKIVP